jgi:quercetin dioxygenase-like cupin family protein
MATIGRLRTRRLGRLGVMTAVGTALIFATSTVNAALVSGALPGAAFTFLSETANDVNIAGEAIRLKIKDPVTVKTTYTIAVAADQFVGGWHYHNGPVIVTVAKGTLTYYDASCGTWDITAGHSYIESTGQVISAKALVSKNQGTTLEWFTTRLYPDGATDPVNVDAPCTPG